MKNIFIVILIVIVIALSVMLVGFSQKANKSIKSLEEERYSRMVAEESLQRNAGKLATLEAQLKSANDKMEKVQYLINQEKTINLDLKKQYDELAKVKSDLESKLKVISEEKTINQSPQPGEVSNQIVPAVGVEK